MKTPKPMTDKSAAYMNKGLTNNASQNGPKGVDFKESEGHSASHVSLGMQQHRRQISKTGDRFNSPHEHLDPSAAIFHKIGRG